MSKVITAGALCTGCGACENICPKSCVIRIKEDAGFQMQKGDGCVDCGLCSKVCPVLNMPEFAYPQKAYAAWATDTTIRKTSASGGVAATLYRYALKQGYYFVGAYLNDSFECHLAIGSTEEDIRKFQNSKYTFSFPDEIYKQVGRLVKQGKDVLFVGLPCQVAAVKNYFKTSNLSFEKLILVDIICHGTPNPDYLKSHIAAVAGREKVEKCFFRDANFDTSKFAYTLYKHTSNDPFYKKYVDEDDLYQIGYHGALIYRDSCYVCQYAQTNRCSDLTIGDFHVWDVESCDIDIENVSTILINSEKGMKLLEDIKSDNALIAIERSLDEPIRGEKQLRHPSIAGPERKQFLVEYQKSHDYELAANIAFRGIVRRRKLKIEKIKMQVKKTIKIFVPRKLWLLMKKSVKKD